MSIGGRIKARRNELGLSQRELAARLGYKDHTTLTRIEAGKVDLNQSKIGQFARALNVTPGYLMGWDAEPPAAALGEIAASVLQSPGILKLVHEYMMLGEDDQATVRALVSSLAAGSIKKD
jgi:transcriptional regulator with XRE-family HTH domain